MRDRLSDRLTDRNRQSETYRQRQRDRAAKLDREETSLTDRD